MKNRKDLQLHFAKDVVEESQLSIEDKDNYLSSSQMIQKLNEDTSEIITKRIEIIYNDFIEQNNQGASLEELEKFNSQLKNDRENQQLNLKNASEVFMQLKNEKLSSLVEEFQSIALIDEEEKRNKDLAIKTLKENISVLKQELFQVKNDYQNVKKSQEIYEGQQSSQLDSDISLYQQGSNTESSFQQIEQAIDLQKELIKNQKLDIQMLHGQEEQLQNKLKNLEKNHCQVKKQLVEENSKKELELAKVIDDKKVQNDKLKKKLDKVIKKCNNLHQDQYQFIQQQVKNQDPSNYCNSLQIQFTELSNEMNQLQNEKNQLEQQLEKQQIQNQIEKKAAQELIQKYKQIDQLETKKQIIKENYEKCKKSCQNLSFSNQQLFGIKKQKEKKLRKMSQVLQSQQEGQKSFQLFSNLFDVTVLVFFVILWLLIFYGSNMIYIKYKIPDL